VGVDAHSPPGI